MYGYQMTFQLTTQQIFSHLINKNSQLGNQIKLKKL